MDTSQPDNQETNPDNPQQPAQEHETHTTALVFLVIVAIVISFVALRGGDSSPLFTDDGDDTVDTEEQPGTSGSLIPREVVETTDTTSTTDLPAGIFVEEERIASNKTAAGGQQIISFSTDRSPAELLSSYEAWMNDAEYEIFQEVEDDRGAKLAARGPDGEQLTVSITNPQDAGSPTRVMIDYVAAQ